MQPPLDHNMHAKRDVLAPFGALKPAGVLGGGLGVDLGALALVRLGLKVRRI